MKGKPWNLICASSCRLREEGSKFLILSSEGGSYLVIDLLAEGYVMFFYPRYAHVQICAKIVYSVLYHSSHGLDNYLAMATMSVEL